ASPLGNRRLWRRRFAHWPGPSGARLRQRLGGAPEVARERQTEWLAGEFSRARRRSRRKKQVDRPGAQSHARIATAECQDRCLARAWLPVEFRPARRLRRSRYLFHTALWSVPG